MRVNIQVDFGHGYVVALTAKDARYLYDQLATLFQQEKEKLVEDFSWQDGTPILGNEAIIDPPIGTSVTMAHDQDCGCLVCFAKANTPSSI